MTSDIKKPAPADRCLSRLVRLRRWRRKPHCGGWWEWREGGRGRSERLLLCEGGTHVADDDAWQQATGVSPEDDGMGHRNYWEGTETTQKMMPGLWMQSLPNDQDEPRGK